MMMTTRMAIFQNAPLEKSDNCEYEGGGELSGGKEGGGRVSTIRPAQLAELPRSEFDPELFPHSTYVKFFVTFATKVPYLTFCDKL